MRYDIFLIFQYIVFIVNIFAIITVLKDSKYNYKPFRVILLLASCVFMISSISEISWATVLFSYAPLLALINNFKSDGKINRHFEGVRDSLGGDKRNIQGLQDGNKTLARQKT